jgi:hypothetical protein
MDAMMSPTCHFYCLGYSASNPYRGLENLHIGESLGSVSQSPALSTIDRAFVEHEVQLSFDEMVPLV